jgi:uncharacterized membrane protein YadS
MEMDNVIVQEAFKRIDQISEKLGTTTAYLWPKLVSWEYTKSIVKLSLVSTFWVFLVTIAIFTWATRKEISKEDGWVVVSWFIIVYTIVVLLISFCLLPDYIAGLTSPEAAAFFRIAGK